MGLLDGFKKLLGETVAGDKKAVKSAFNLLTGQHPQPQQPTPQQAYRAVDGINSALATPIGPYDPSGSSPNIQLPMFSPLVGPPTTRVDPTVRWGVRVPGTNKMTPGFTPGNRSGSIATPDEMVTPWSVDQPRPFSNRLPGSVAPATAIKLPLAPVPKRRPAVRFSA